MDLAITSLGVVSPFGVGRAVWEAALADPPNAVARAFRSPSEVLEALPDARTAEVWGFDPKQHLGRRGHRTFDRLTKFLIAAAKYTLIDANVKDAGGNYVGPLGPERIGICSATAYGSLDAITELNLVAELEAPRFINPARFPNTVINAAAGYVSIWEDLRGPNTTIVDGNCGALDAVLVAETHLRQGRADAFLVGGGEVVSEALYRALSKLGVVAQTGGSGVTMGEGAAYLFVEPRTAAEARGATLLASLRGYGTAFEPPPSEAQLVHASADAVERASRDALAEAGLQPQDVDVVAAATGGIDLIDAAEFEGLRAVFGETACIATPKALHGETFGAAGAFGLASSLAWIGGAPVAPCAQGSAAGEVRTVLVSTVGYYGNASAAIIRAI
jgi:3-oxoacyl-[acyl-carrier-protein] synthase II